MSLIAMIFSFNFWVSKTSLNLTFILSPLDWRLGIYFKAAEPEADYAIQRLHIQIPTLVLELYWAPVEVIERLQEDLGDDY